MTHQINKKEETKLIVITRNDIHPGYQAVQSCHAVADFAAEHPDTFKKWKQESNSIICLSVKSEPELLKLFDKFKQLTPATLFYEPDISAYTSFCMYGTPDVRKKTGNLPLLLKNKPESHVEANTKNV